MLRRRQRRTLLPSPLLLIAGILTLSFTAGSNGGVDKSAPIWAQNALPLHSALSDMSTAQAQAGIEGLSNDSKIATNWVRSVTDFGAQCDGTHDDRPALARAIQAVSNYGGGTVELPTGTCLIHTTSTAPSLTVPRGVSIVGSGRDATRLLLTSDQPYGYRELFRVSGGDLLLADFSVKAAASFSGVVFRLHQGSDIRFRGVDIDGGKSDMGDRYVHAFMTADAGTLMNLDIVEVSVVRCDSGFLQANNSSAKVTGIRITRSYFKSNRGDALNFNAPSGNIKNVEVSDSFFMGGDGFAIALANVNGVQVSGNRLARYAREFIHIENSSKNINLSGNYFSHNLVLKEEWYSFIFVISGSHDISIYNNEFGTAQRLDGFQVIYIGPGGDYPAPSEIRIHSNTVTLARGSRAISVYGGAKVDYRK